ncbi:MAG: DUF3426 domain-containing protein [Rhodospirillales bacterium]
MILTCPSCQKRFVVDESALRPAGRTVRCSRCRHTWHQAAPDGPAAPEPPRVVIEPPAPRPPDRIRPRRELPPEPARRRRPSAATLAWAAFALAVVIVLGGFLAMREAVVAAFPAAERIYAAIGLAEEPGVGLELRRVASREVARDGARVLMVEGEIANISDKVRDVPRMRAALFDDRERALKSWTFSAPDPKLLPGETSKFVTELESPPTGAVRLTILFDGA